MKYDRTIIAYHGCDASVARKLLSGGMFEPSRNGYDWLGSGIYFWEYGHDRALRFAREQQKRKRVQDPAVIGAILQLGKCFDLMDTKFTSELPMAFELFRQHCETEGKPLPRNEGSDPDKKLRRLDCAVLDFWFDHLEREEGIVYDSVRCAFIEGDSIYDGSGIRKETHIQIAVRNPACIVGLFSPR